MRRAAARQPVLPLAALCTAAVASMAQAQGVVDAFYADPVDRYDHRILGDTPDHGTLVMQLDDGRTLRIVLPKTRVFEDTFPRLADVDGDGAHEVTVVETDLRLGARLAVYGPAGLIAATAFIGRPHRWFAQAGAMDLDGDGQVEIGYVDRPHLAKVLRVVRFQNGALRQIASLEGVTNHRIGDPAISTGLRRCADGPPEFVMFDMDWTRVVAIALDGAKLRARPAGRSLARALACEN